MEQIERRDGIIYYGHRQCKSADEAYLKFRDSYNASVGKVAFRRLNRLGSRKERVHGYGFVFDTLFKTEQPFKRIPVRMLGLISGSYCRILDGRYIPDCTEDEYQDWIDLIFSEGSGRLYLVGKKLKTGRTSKRLNVRYR